MNLLDPPTMELEQKSLWRSRDAEGSYISGLHHHLMLTSRSSVAANSKSAVVQYLEAAGPFIYSVRST